MGGAAMFRNRPLEQMYRDVRAGMFHQPLAGQEGMAFLGRLAGPCRPTSPSLASSPSSGRPLLSLKPLFSGASD